MLQPSVQVQRSVNTELMKEIVSQSESSEIYLAMTSASPSTSVFSSSSNPGDQRHTPPPPLSNCSQSSQFTSNETPCYESPANKLHPPNNQSTNKQSTSVQLHPPTSNQFTSDQLHPPTSNQFTSDQLHPPTSNQQPKTSHQSTSDLLPLFNSQPPSNQLHVPSPSTWPKTVTPPTTHPMSSYPPAVSSFSLAPNLTSPPNSNPASNLTSLAYSLDSDYQVWQQLQSRQFDNMDEQVSWSPVSPPMSSSSYPSHHSTHNCSRVGRSQSISLPLLGQP